MRGRERVRDRRGQRESGERERDGRERREEEIGQEGRERREGKRWGREVKR